MTKLLQDKRYRLWFAFMLVSLFGILLMISTTYIHGSAGERGYKAETTILWIYFTFLSNLSGFIVSAIVVSNKFNINSKHLQRAKTFMAVNLTVTGIIFWAILSWKIGGYIPIHIVTTLCVHLVTPSLALITYFYEAKNTVIEKKADPVGTMIINMIFPVLWLIMAVSLYYTMGGIKDYAIYGFLDFEHTSIIMSIVVILAIGMMYPGLTYLYSKIYNK